ncbi:hypothetical protein M4951_16305 [Blastopirellula sp. J2-11]|uniref:hypothetical protein n=1 Tax=Blastopirellula sp. J2-11 TaxID=2943192 RepID=UPI0021C658E5|nr:hypothetical protein [Blastopirellula sp. J2-11]UUO04943.1 hypothetical protein M4951_16305 [Blastopirellula sp. J2-11]
MDMDYMLFSRRILLGWTVFTCLAYSLGCTSQPGNVKPRYEISGNVTFAGQPVPQGTIFLMPDPQKGNTGPGSTGIIRNGEFRIPAQRGVVGGAYVVSITGFAAPTGMSSEEDPMIGDPLFAEFQTFTDLAAERSTQSFEVPASQKKVKK